MKKFTTLTMAALLSFPASLTFTSCSNENLEKEMEDDPIEYTEAEFEKDFQESRCLVKPVPQDVIDRVMPIYAKATIGPQEVTTVHQLAILSSICATRKNDGPITVTDASLNGEDVTLVTLGGTERTEGQATTMEECTLSALGKSNEYLTAVVNLFEENVIPEDKPVVVAGISLGGMVAQQLLGVEDIMDDYTIKAVIAFGSPFILPLDRQGVKVVRFADVHDKVPPVGESFLRSGVLTVGKMTRRSLLKKLDEMDAVEKIARTSKYTDMIEAHALSYIEDACWDNVDFLGDPERKNVLVLKETMKFYPAPKLSRR